MSFRAIFEIADMSSGFDDFWRYHVIEALPTVGMLVCFDSAPPADWMEFKVVAVEWWQAPLCTKHDCYLIRLKLDEVGWQIDTDFASFVEILKKSGWTDKGRKGDE